MSDSSSDSGSRRDARAHRDPSRRVLLVAKRDDVAVEVTTGLAHRPDLSFFRVATPERALAVLDDLEEHGRFALVIADNDTHPTGGFYLAKEVRYRRDMGRVVPATLLLLARPQDTWLSDWSQADAYVVKPLDPFDLAETVEAMVEGKPLPALPGVGGDARWAPYDLPLRGRPELDWGGEDRPGGQIPAGGS